jgi:choline-sulfatase
MTFEENMAKLNDKPDIIIVITDQERATQHFPPDWEQNNLHSMTFLKKHGYSFDRAFCNTCMCSPSRATLFTGTYPAQHQVTQTLTWGGRYSPAEVTIDPTFFNLARMLQPQGYDVQYRGKWHLSKGFTENGLTAADVALYGFMGWIPPDAGEDVKPENFGGGFANHDEAYVNQAIKYLQQVKERRAKGDMRPYCLVLALVNPHDVLCYPNGVMYGYLPPDWEQRTVGLPETVNENLLLNKKPVPQVFARLGAGALLGPLPTDNDKLNYINFYAHTLKKIDREIGRFVHELYAGDEQQNRLADSAILFRLADHGEMGMAHGGMRQKAFNAYEETLRIPFIISNPLLFPNDGKPKGSKHLATLIDVMPTIAALTNADTSSANLKGVNLLPAIKDDKPVQDAILFTFDDTKAGSATRPSAVPAANRVRCVRTSKWKYAYYFDALGQYAEQYELYNLEETADPLEYNNLAYDPAYQQQREEMATLLANLEREKLLVRKLAMEESEFWQWFERLERE